MTEVLETANETWGFWGASTRNEYPVAVAWEAASRFLAARFGLSAARTRDLLDARFGRHLADDLSFAAQPLTAAGIAAHLEARFATDRPDWTRWAYTEIAALNALAR